MKPEILNIKKKLFKLKDKEKYKVKFGSKYSPDNTVTIRPDIKEKKNGKSPD